MHLESFSSFSESAPDSITVSDFLLNTDCRVQTFQNMEHSITQKGKINTWLE